MIFQSYEFLLFFAVTLAVCLPAARRSVPAAKALLTLASLLFYLWGFEENALLGFVVLLAGSWVSFSAGRYLTARRQRDGSAKAVFALALIWHIAVLVAFKYTPKSYHKQMRDLIRAGADHHSLVYGGDASLKRRLRVWKNHLGNIKRFGKYNKVPTED